MQEVVETGSKLFSTGGQDRGLNLNTQLTLAGLDDVMKKNPMRMHWTYTNDQGKQEHILTVVKSPEAPKEGSFRLFINPDKPQYDQIHMIYVTEETTDPQKESHTVTYFDCENLGLKGPVLDAYKADYQSTKSD